jgi:putative DNA primase/helicase
VPPSAKLLADIRDVFNAAPVDRITTQHLLEALAGDDLKPWATYNRGKPLSARQLGHLLEDYGVSSKDLKLAHGEVKKGFTREQFSDAFERYLPPQAEVHSATPLPERKTPRVLGTYPVAGSESGSATASASATSKPSPSQEGSAVADETRRPEGGMLNDSVEHIACSHGGTVRTDAPDDSHLRAPPMGELGSHRDQGRAAQ